MQAVASVSLDLDNQWSYLKTHGSPEWSSYPSYLELVVPRVLEFLARSKTTISFFIVGRDAANPRHHSVLRALADAGHEIGNHSFNHEPWLHLYEREALEREMRDAEDAIVAATGQKPVGFRGPGFSLSQGTLEVLAARGYLYDATVFPNVLNPLARAYFFWNSNLTKEEKEQRKALFGTFADARRPLKAFSWNLAENRRLYELPVTTMPVFRTPIHLSYILYLAKYSKPLARLYFRFALALCRMTNTEPSILLHPLDFISSEDLKGLDFFPGMDVSTDTKLGLVDEVLELLAKHYRLTTVREHVEVSRAVADTRVRAPQF